MARGPRGRCARSDGREAGLGGGLLACARSSSTATARSARAERRSSSPMPTTPATGAPRHAARGDPRGRAFRPRPRLPGGTHAIGDRANRQVLDAYEKAFAERPEVKDPRFRIEHAQILDAGRHPALRPALGAGLDAGDPLPLRPAMGARSGSARRASPRAPTSWRKLLHSGARIVNGHRRARRGRLADPELPRHA